MAPMNFGQHAEIEKGQSQDSGGRQIYIGRSREEMDGGSHDGCQNTRHNYGEFTAAGAEKFKKAGIESYH